MTLGGLKVPLFERESFVRRAMIAWPCYRKSDALPVVAGLLMHRAYWLDRGAGSGATPRLTVMIR